MAKKKKEDMNEEYHPIYYNLEKLCEKHGEGVSSVCEEITGSRGNLSTWKKGKINPTWLIALSNKFGVSTDFIVGITDDPEQAPKRMELSENVRAVARRLDNLGEDSVEAISVIISKMEAVGDEALREDGALGEDEEEK